MIYQAVACVIYLLILCALGYLGYRRTQTHTDYMIAGRQTHYMVMALSYGATFISTSAIVGFGGLAANLGMGVLWLTFLCVFVGVFIAFVFFGKRTRALGAALDAHTFPELLGKRFNSKRIQVFTGLLIFLFMPIYAASVIKGGANFVEAYFGISYDVSLIAFVTIVAVYVWLGGLKSVMYTDAFQAGILFIAMTVLIVIAYVKLGGIIPAHLKLTELISNPDVHKEVTPLISKGFRGWTSMPEFNSPLWWTLVSSVVGAVGFGVLTQPQLVVRFMSVKSGKELNRAVLSGGLFILVMTGGAFVVGALSNVLLYESTGKIAMSASGGVNDLIIPTFITYYLPQWYGAIFMLAMLAAAMSTLSSQFHTMGTALGRDVCEQVLTRAHSSLKLSRVGILIVIIISTLLAWLTKYLDASDGIIAKGTIVFFEMTTSVFLVAYIGGLYLKKMPKLAAEMSILFGAITWLIWTFFISSNAESLMICKLITGKPSLVAGTSYQFLAVIGTSIVGVVAALLGACVGWIAKGR